MTIGILGVVNQWYKEDVGEKTAFALGFKKSKGEKTGGDLPFGKRLARDGKHLVPAKREQKVIRYIRRLHRNGDGLSLRKIAERLNEEKVPCRGKNWYATTIVRILKSSAKKTGGPS